MSEPVGRDYLAEIDKRIAVATSGTCWAAPVVAAQIHDELLADDPGLLDGWLHAIAVEALRQAIANRSRHVRNAARRRGKPRAFAAAAGGDPAVLAGMFAADLVTAPDQSRKRVADMTGPDHLYVAERYAGSGNRALLLAEFHRQVAKRIGDRRTADVLTEDEYARMYDSIAGQAA